MGLCGTGRPCMCLLVAVICILPLLSDAAASTAEVVSCPGQLLAALRDSNISTVVLAGNCSLAEIGDNHYVHILRNVTVTGRPGSLPELDLAFKHEVLALCPSCSMTLRSLALTRARRGAGDGVQAIVGSEQRGAVLLLQDVVRHRIACSPAKDAAAVISETPRGAVAWRSTMGSQQLRVGSAEYKGATYPQSLLLGDVAVQLELSHQEGRVSHTASGKQGHSGGLTLWQKNVSRVCDNIVTDECLLAKGAETCVNDLIDQVLAAELRQGGAAALRPPLIAVAVVVPVVAVGLVAAAAVCWVRRRQRTRRSSLPSSSWPPAHGKPARPASVSFTSSRPSRDGFDPRLCKADSTTESMLQRKVSMDVRISQQTSRPPLGGAMAGWALCGMSTSPHAGEVADASVEFGELLGSGSFGRVYKARWNGQDVAVKVIEHCESTMYAVEHEAALMLSLNHENIGSLGALSAFSRGSRGGGAASRLESANTTSSVWQARPAKAETWLVQEFCDRGTLADVAAGWQPKAECEAQMMERLLLLLDAAKGLAALHSESVVHGDLNARNVLVVSNGASACGMTAKVADLGLSRSIKQNSHRTTNTVGTMNHTAPELLRYGRMSPAIDVYSFGVMMHQLYTNQVPFHKLHYGQFFETVVLQCLRPVIPPGMPRDYQALMAACWAAEPADRPSAAQVAACLQAMAAERRARLLEQPGSPAAGPSVWEVLQVQPPGKDQDEEQQAAALSSPAGVLASPAGSEGSWHGYVQRGGAEVAPDPGHHHATSAAGEAVQQPAGVPSRAPAVDSRRHDGHIAQHGDDDAGHSHAVRWFV
ncbi:hypothetical protein OEZ86_008242 [Tetradesmus obliquus]|nr:hypothetical protein OEZ86_008242 [Tetradesmus obliquus]